MHATTAPLVAPRAVLALLLPLFVLLAIGAALRASRRLDPATASPVLNTLILEVTMPALVVLVLARAHLELGLLWAVVPALVATLVCIALASLAVRALGYSRAAQGAAGLTAGFCNTAFLGVPVIVSLYGERSSAGPAAVLLDAIVTTGLIWTVGIAFASRMGARADTPRTTALAQLGRLARQPLVIALFAGLALNALGLTLPGWIARALGLVGGTTSALVFVALGLALDPRALRGRVRAVGVATLVKLVVAPAIALGVAWALGLRGPVGEVSVLQSAMPSAMVSAIVAASYGCDAALASGVAVASTVGSLLSLVAVAELMRAVGV